MKTSSLQVRICVLQLSEAYLEGMKTTLQASFLCSLAVSEAYLEGMKTFSFAAPPSSAQLRPKPTSKE